MPVICDPYSSPKKIIKEAGWKEIQSVAESLIKETRNSRTLKGKNPDSVCVIEVGNPKEHRYFNFNPAYPGCLNHAESVLGYRWRIANDEEEAACLKQDEHDQREAYLKSEAGKKAMNDALAVQAMKMIVNSGQVTQAPQVSEPPVPVTENTKTANELKANKKI